MNPSAAHNLSPLLLTPLIGREQELATLVDRLQQSTVRLLTLTGPPGVGKTRLALQAVTALQPHFADGVHFVALAAVTDPALVIATIAQSLGLRQEGERSFATRLHDFCRTKQLLLLLDNCEQVTTAAPDLLDLLAQAPALKLLVTSRIRLHVRIEQELSLLPLPLPEPAADMVQLAQNPAVALLVQRIQAVKSDFELSPDNSAAVATLCRRLDGLPLALELAAVHSKLLPPAALLARLEKARHQLLRGGGRDYPTRQQTLYDTLAWSYALLAPIQQRLFRRLAIFIGGCTVEAAESMATWPTEAAGDDFAALTTLIDHHLLVLLSSPLDAGTAAAIPRLTMLESIRDYASEQLRTAGEEEEAHRHHAKLYRLLVEQAAPALMGPEQQQWLDRLESEHDNLRAALRWSLSQAGDDTALHIAGALWQFWFARGYMGEGLQWLQRALAHGQPNATATRANAAGGAAMLAAYLGHYQAAAQAAEMSLAICRQLNIPPGISAALNGLAFISGMTGDHTKAATLTQESVAIGRTLGAPEVLTQALYYQALTAWLAGDYALAQTAIDEGLRLCQQLGDSRTVASFLYGRGLVTVAQQEYDQARPYFEESMGALRQLGDKRSVTMCLAGLADVELSHQAPARAREYIGEALQLSHQVGDRWFAAYTIDGLAAVATLEGEAIHAARFFAAADAMRNAIGAATPAARQSIRAAALQSIQRHLDQPTFAAAWAEGQHLSLEAILAQPILVRPYTEQPHQTLPASAPSPSLTTLTRREREVLRLVTQGMTDAQIAETLVISPHTVHTHLSTIYSKLGVASRTAAAHVAMQQQLV